MSVMRGTCLFVITLATALSLPLGEKQLWNEQIDFILMWFDLATVEGKDTVFDIPNMVTDEVAIRGARLGNAGTLIRDSDVFMEEPRIDDMKISGNFALGKFQLMVNDFRYKKYSGPANFTAERNSVEVSYTLKHHYSPRSCQMDWEEFQLAPFSKVIMHSNDEEYSEKDFTKEVNSVILPSLNRYFKSEEYKKILNRNLDFCFVKLFK